MTAPLLLELFAGDALCGAIRNGLGAEPGKIEHRRFPDGESYVRIIADCVGRDVVIVCALEHPDEKILRLLFAARTLREIGAASLSLIVPYLPYLRQDQAFAPGEAVSARHFAGLLAGHFDRIVTVDPHLHRIAELGSVCPIECIVVSAASSIAAWIGANVAQPILIGPDEESEQWVASVAGLAGAPYAIGRKVRRGDRDVSVSLPASVSAGEQTPVLVDDIISTGRTMAEAVTQLVGSEHRAPVCIGVHALFAPDALAQLYAAGAGEVITCNTISHASNAIDIAPVLVDALDQAMRQARVDRTDQDRS